MHVQTTKLDELLSGLAAAGSKVSLPTDKERASTVHIRQSIVAAQQQLGAGADADKEEEPLIVKISVKKK